MKLLRTKHFLFTEGDVCSPTESVTVSDDFKCFAFYRNLDGAETHGNCIIMDFAAFNSDTNILPNCNTVKDLEQLIADELYENREQIKEIISELPDDDIIKSMGIRPAIFFLIGPDALRSCLEIIRQHQ